MVNELIHLAAKHGCDVKMEPQNGKTRVWLTLGKHDYVFFADDTAGEEVWLEVAEKGIKYLEKMNRRDKCGLTE